MKYQNFTSSSGTTYTTTWAPVDPDLIWVVFEGQICERVTSSPGLLQYTSSGTTLTLGWSKASGDNLFVFVEDNSNNMLSAETPSGAMDGSNRTFTIAQTIPSGSEPIVMLNGLILHPSGGSGALEYTRSGSTITLSTNTSPPVSSDMLQVFVTATKLSGAQFDAFALTGIQDGSNHFFATTNPQVFGYDHQGVLFQNGRAALTQTGIPAPLRYLYDQPTAYLIIGTPPTSTDRLTLYITGLAAAVDNPFQVWLSSGQQRVVLAELTLAQGDGTKQVFYSSREYATDPTDVPANLEYRGHITGVPRIKRAMQGAFTGQSLISYTDLILANGEGDLDADFGQGGWSTDGQAVSLWLTGTRKDLSFANRQQLFAGVMDPHRGQSDSITITLRDLGKRLTRTFSLSTLDAGTWPNIPDANNGRYIPLIFGRVLNLSPIVVDPDNLIYFIGNVSSVEAVYDQGISVPYLFSQGNRIELLSQPAGQVTCDVTGPTTGAYNTKLGYVIESILRTYASYGDADFNLNALLFFQAQTLWDVGLVINTPETIASALDRLLAGIPAYYFLSRSGQFTIGLVQATTTRAPALSFDRLTHSLGQGMQFTIQSPKWRVNLGYAPIETVQSNLQQVDLTDDRRDRLQQAFLTQTFADTSVKMTFPDAEDEATIQTRLCNASDALALAQQRLALLKTPHFVVTDTFDSTPVRIDIGDIVGYTSDRYSLGASNNAWLVTGLEETLGVERGNSRIAVTLWQ